MFIGLKFMSIRRKKADYLMVLIKHVINIPLSHTQRTHPVIPDVGNRESRVPTYEYALPATPLCHSRRE